MRRKKMQRIKLFSDSRVKLFSNTLRTVKCQDCGEVLETAANVSQILCPKCGGKRFNLYKKREPIFTEEKGEDLKESDLTKNLKKFSGQTLTKDEFTKTFSESDLVEKGYAKKVGNDYQISPYASEVERMFSKISITVTREIDLDPAITSGECPFGEAIKGIEGPGKGIMLIRKAHGGLRDESWIEDSHIVDDLKAEYGGENKGIKQFMDILNNRYPDAPENIIDDLVSRGAITINGNQITINK